MQNEHKIVAEAKANKDKLLQAYASTYEKNKPLGKSVKKIVNKIKQRMQEIINNNYF